MVRVLFVVKLACRTKKCLDISALGSFCKSVAKLSSQVWARAEAAVGDGGHPSVWLTVAPGPEPGSRSICRVLVAVIDGRCSQIRRENYRFEACISPPSSTDGPLTRSVGLGGRSFPARWLLFGSGCLPEGRPRWEWPG